MNIYHCCTQKTASQWFKKLYSDPMFIKHTGLKVSKYRAEPAPVGINYIFVDLFVSYNAYKEWKTKQEHKVFFILRDPRDVVISWYYSIRYSHRVIGEIRRWRANLNAVSVKDGLKYSIRKLTSRGYFDKQLSWVVNRPDVIFKYEDFIKNNYKFLKELFDYTEIELPDKVLRTLCSKYSFKSITGRDMGVQNLTWNLRKGIAGDWKMHFDSDLINYFNRVTNNVAEALNYS